jgi:thiol-disulfide isomerase/thioredoxin
VKRLYIICLLSLLFCNYCLADYFDEHKTLAIGATAPDFNLKGVDGKMYSLASFKRSAVLVIVFTCNHCPTAQAYEDRIIQLKKNFGPKGVALVAIMPNDPRSITLNELDYTDISDSYEEMQMRAKQKQFNFPYLFDGETQAVAKAYGPSTTPHVFIFNKERKLVYQGRIDDMEKPSKTPTSYDTRDAINAVLNNKEVANSTTKVFGCSVKWIEKEELVKEKMAKWALEPVKLDTITEQGVKELVKNNGDKLRLINIWATWCGPCVEEFGDFIIINRMYRGRDFEFISISADDPSLKEKVYKFLSKEQASNTNYIFNTDNKYKLIEAVDPQWQGGLPYTILVEPGGKIVYAKQGPIDPAKMKTMIVDNPLIGRFFK